MTDLQNYYDMIDEPPAMTLTPWEMQQHMQLILITQMIIQNHAVMNNYPLEYRKFLMDNVLPECRAAIMNNIHHMSHCSLLLHDMFMAYIRHLHRIT